MTKSLRERERKMTTGEDDASTPESAAASAAASATLVTATTAGNNPDKEKKKHPCGKCDEEVTTKSLMCQACDSWFHFARIPGMNKEFFDSCNLAMEMYGYSPFMCQGCRKVVAKFNRSMKDLGKVVHNILSGADDLV